jgi:glutamine amidotransferase
MPVDLVLVDSGGANIGSVLYALERLDVVAELSNDADRIRSASHVILPGVGAAGSAMRKLRNNGLDRVIPGLTQPVLGICLGMQLLYEGSDETDLDCLGILPGRATRFSPRDGLRVPHMGWNRIQPTVDDPLLDGLSANDFAYFVHSYALPVNEFTLASCDHGEPFAAMSRRNNFHAVQFHPERSSRVGKQVLHNFIRIS